MKRALNWVVITIITAITVVIIYNIGINFNRVINCKASVDKENILQYVEFVGEVSEINKTSVEKMLLEEVSEEALSYVINSGGKIVVVYNENRDVREYINETYNFSIPKSKYGIDGITIPYRDIFGNLVKTDVVVYCNGILVGDLGHEMGHVYDLTHGNMSKTNEFNEIYNNKENISKKAMYYVNDSISYLESTPQEYFAELYKRYCRGEFKKGTNDETDSVIEYFERIV